MGGSGCSDALTLTNLVHEEHRKEIENHGKNDKGGNPELEAKYTAPGDKGPEPHSEQDDCYEPRDKGEPSHQVSLSDIRDSFNVRFLSD